MSQQSNTENQLADTFVRTGTFGDAPWTLDEKGTLTIGHGSYHGRFRSLEDRSFDFKCDDGKKLPSQAVLRVVSTEKLTVSGNLEGLFYSERKDKPFKNVISMDLSGWITEDVSSMAYMFKGCSKLTSLNLGSFNTSNVTDMEYMFEGCMKLTNLDLGSFNTGSYANIVFSYHHYYRR